MAARTQLRVKLYEHEGGGWIADGGALGSGGGPTVIGALEDLVRTMKRDAVEWVDRALEDARKGREQVDGS